MSTAEEIARVRRRITKLSRWTQGASARTAGGAPVEPDAFVAVRWCVEGARRRERMTDDVYWHIERVSAELFGCSPLGVNDELGHAAVLRVLDEAERRAKEEGDV
ncbi:MAG: hypothetical protein GEU73_06015 [Chloroflexi bacterium]|nr:hypothetical protein [Chloroflexota bacterium]